VLQTLSQVYSFAQRTFGQGVSVDEIATVIQSVPGVVAVNVKELHTVASSAGGDLSSPVATSEVTEVHTVTSAANSFLRRRMMPLRYNKFHVPVTTPISYLRRRQPVSSSLAQVNIWRSQILQTPLPRPQPQSVTRIYPYLPVANPNSLPQPAEILVLDPDPGSVVLGVMS
jgi:hypothetical protein